MVLSWGTANNFSGYESRRKTLLKDHSMVRPGQRL
jgi:hypothetical protein